VGGEKGSSSRWIARRGHRLATHFPFTGGSSHDGENYRFR
jgi:hypothetical protein